MKIEIYTDFKKTKSLEIDVVNKPKDFIFENSSDSD